MASHEDFYTQSTSRPLSQTQFPGSPFTSETPPPPPPKPGSHNASGRGTPQVPPSPLTQSSFDRPPPPLPIQSADTPRPVPPVPPTPSTPSYLNTQPHPDNSNSTIPYSQAPPLPSPFLPDSLPSKSTADLAPILSNPLLLSALASTHPAHAESMAPLTTAVDTNLALTSRLLRLQNHLTSIREQTQQLLLQHTTLSTQWRRKQAEMDVALQPWSPKAMYGRLVSGIAEQEAIVRAVEESFLEEGGVEEYGRGNSAGKASEREVGDWVKRVREGTAVLEGRRESRARWDEGRVGGWR